MEANSPLEELRLNERVTLTGTRYEFLTIGGQRHALELYDGDTPVITKDTLDVLWSGGGRTTVFLRNVVVVRETPFSRTLSRRQWESVGKLSSPTSEPGTTSASASTNESPDPPSLL
jgi:hypothetical protein